MCKLHRVFMCMTVTNSIGGSSFSRLKLIKGSASYQNGAASFEQDFTYGHRHWHPEDHRLQANKNSFSSRRRIRQYAALLPCLTPLEPQRETVSDSSPSSRGGAERSCVKYQNWNITNSPSRICTDGRSPCPGWTHAEPSTLRLSPAAPSLVHVMTALDGSHPDHLRRSPLIQIQQRFQEVI